MKNKTKLLPGQVSRRVFLRGLGACVALPALESFKPLTALAAPASNASLGVTATGAPLRTAFVYFPNGAIPGDWWPQAPGANVPFSRTLQPLEKFRSSLQILGGLKHTNAEAGPDGAGDHARANGTFLTGVRMKKSASDIRAGVSIDQVMAKSIGHLTRFPSLELTCDQVRKAGVCDSGYSCAYQHNISWSSPTTPMTPEYNPRLAFERLFGSGSPGQRRESLKLRQQQQRSVLDFVMEEARDLQRRLAPQDKDKVDQYLTGVREIETRIQRAESFENINDPAIETPAGIPANHEEYVQLMYDMMVLAFQSDSTRVITMLLAHDGSNRSFSDIGVSEGHHDLSHHQNKEDMIRKVAEIDLWYVRQFAKFLEKLDKVQDTDGRSLLHNSMIVYGGGNADGNRHTHHNLPILLAGSGGGTFQTNRYVRVDSEPTTNLFLSMADRLGIKDLERFGDSSGRLTVV